MNEDTRKLLEECTSGCKMAVESMGQVKEYIEDSELLQVIDSCKQKHEKLEQDAAALLAELGKPEKEPGAMASTFSLFTTEMKLMMNADNHKIAKLMMDGSNMGVQSLSEYQNKYAEASKEAKDVVKKLVKTEEDFMKELKPFL